RVMNMLSKATPEQKQSLEAKICEEWKAVEVKSDPEAIRSFVGMFDVPFEVGRQARLKLAEFVVEKKASASYLEAELLLHQLRVPAYRDEAAVGGVALDALARLEIAKSKPESMRQAMEYYRELGARFPKTVIRDGKTGADLMGKVFEDKRFLAYL